MNQQAVATYQGQAAPGRLKFDLMDPAAFQHIQRVAGMYAASPLFPDHLRKNGQQAALANAVLVMNIADRLKEDPLTVAQNIYFVSGKPGWSAAYMIAKANQFGVFKEPIDYDIKGKGDDLEVTAFAKLAKTGKRVEITASMKMAKAEGWTSNKKYQSMPEVMLRYRAATLLIRTTCPEVMVGIPRTTDEIEDTEAAMRDVTPDQGAPDYGPVPEPEYPRQNVEDAETVEEAEPVKDEKPAEPKPVNRQRPAPAPKKEPEPEPETETAAEPEETVEQESEPEPEAKPEPKKAAEKTERKDWSTFMAAVKRDLDQSEGDIGGVIGFYGEQLRDMRKSDPEAFAELESQLGIDVASEL